MGKIKLNTDRIIGLSAMLISLLTLVIFVFQTNIIRTQSRLSVAPRLAFNSSLDTPDSISYYTLHIINKGLGPGIVESVNIIYEGNRSELNFISFFEKNFPRFNDYGRIIQNMPISTGTTLSEKEAIKLLTFSFHKKKTNQIMEYLGAGEEGQDPYQIEIIYSSIYGEKWKVNSNIDGHPIKL